MIMLDHNELDLNKYPYFCKEGHRFDESFIDPRNGCIGCKICYDRETGVISGDISMVEGSRNVTPAVDR